MKNIYHRDIVEILLECGREGLRIKNIARRIYNRHADFFVSDIIYDEIRNSVGRYLWDQIIEVHNLERMMNYGMDRMKFAMPVLSGQHIRMKTKLEELANLRGAIKTTIKFTIEIQETGKKALEGLATFIYYFKS